MQMNLFFNAKRVLNQDPFTDFLRERRGQSSQLGKRPEACYQTTKIEPNIDKWPSRAVQKNFKKMKKKLVTP